MPVPGPAPCRTICEYLCVTCQQYVKAWQCTGLEPTCLEGSETEDEIVFKMAGVAFQRVTESWEGRHHCRLV